MDSFSSNWLSAISQPLAAKHIEFFLRFAIISIAATGVYYGLVIDQTPSLYSPELWPYHKYESSVLFFGCYSYLVMNWAWYVVQHTGKYNGPRRSFRLVDFIAGSVLCIFLFFLDILLPSQPWPVEGWSARLEFSDLVFAFLPYLVASVMFLCLMRLYTGKSNSEEKQKLQFIHILRNPLQVIFITFAIWVSFDFVDMYLVGGLGWVAGQMGYLDPFDTLKSVLFSISNCFIYGIWLSLLSECYKSWGREDPNK